MSSSEKIFRAIFRTSPPPEVLHRFEEASRTVFANVDEATRRQVDALVERVSDLEALELFWRFKDAQNFLTLRFRLMVYVAECSPSMRAILVNGDDRFFSAILAMIGAVFQTVYKWLKGSFLFARESG